MALTISEESAKFQPNRELYAHSGSSMKIAVFKVTFDNSYTTGGLAFNPASYGISTPIAVIAADASGYSFEYDYTNKKLKAMFYDYANSASGPAIEVTAATDLSAVITRVIVIGF